MKKIKLTILTFTLTIIFASIFLTSCSQQTKIDPKLYDKSKQTAFNFVQNSQTFQTHQGFDLEHTNESITTCGQNCFEFQLKYSVLDKTTGYTTTIQVTNNDPKFKTQPTPLN